MGNYLGRGLDRISNIEILTNLVFDGSSSYSITKGSVAFTPNSAQSCLLSIDGVVQATNFTVNGSTIDFGVAIASTSVCNFFLHYGTGVMTVPSDGSVTESKIGSNAVTSAKMFSSFANGITMADQWRLTADTNESTNADVTSNWERNDSSGYGSLSTGLTESSGIFSFPSTGIYLILFTASYITVAGDTFCQFQLNTTLNNSSYNAVSEAVGGAGSSSTTITTGSAQFIFDVTNTTNNKFKFSTANFTTSTRLKGDTSINETHFTAFRLGDT